MSTPNVYGLIQFGRLSANGALPQKPSPGKARRGSPDEIRPQGNCEQARLETRLKQAARRETAYNPEEYDPLSAISPLTGHCNAVAHYIQKRFGGVILQATVHYQVNGKPKRIAHFWNRFSDGTEVDYSASQWGLSHQTPLSDKQLKFPLQKTVQTSKGKLSLSVLSVSSSRVVPNRKTINPRFTQFEKNLLRTL